MRLLLDNGELLPRIVGLHRGLARPQQPAAVLVTVKGTSLCDGLRPPFERARHLLFD